MNEMHRLDLAMQLVEANGALEPPSGLWNGVYNRISGPDAALESPTRSHLRIYPNRLRYATLAVTAALVILAALIFSPRQPAPLPNSVAAEYVEAHALGAETGLFADRFSLASVSASAEAEKE